MANTILAGGVIVIDATADNIIPSGQPVYVKAARWTGATGAGTANLGDAGFTTAKVGFSVAAANAPDVVYFNPPLKLDGLRCSVLASGVLTVYCQP